MSVHPSLIKETVGETFWGHDGKRYVCESHDPRKGFWMKQVDAAEGEEPRVTCISERAIGRTFHLVGKMN